MSQESRKSVKVYTDGGAKPNPGPGGFGAILLYGEHRRELTGGFRKTTNNRMEILGAIVALETLSQPCNVTIHSDSQYLVNAMTKGWVKKWRHKNWMRTETEKALNSDLWVRLDDLCRLHAVSWVWVRGHAGNPLNERCDVLATQARTASNLAIDAGFEEEGAPGTRPVALVPDECGCAEVPVEETSTEMEGECRKCGSGLIRKKPKRAPRPDQPYYYAWYLVCSGCAAQYMPEEAKVPQVLPKARPADRAR